MMIFAYGSNMNITRLRARVPSARKTRNVYLPDYTLACNKVSKDGSAKANIVPAENAQVWGVIFEIDDAQKGNLDAAEGLGRGYNETTLTFFDENGNEHEAQVYIADPIATDNNLRPYDWYQNYILTGATENDLPQNYIQQLAAIEFDIDRDEERREENMLS